MSLVACTLSLVTTEETAMSYELERTDKASVRGAVKVTAEIEGARWRRRW